MILFWLLCALLVAIALAFVLPPLMEGEVKTESKDDSGRREANLAVYRDQLAELERDMNNGLVEREQFEQDRDEMERRLLEDVSTPKDEAKKQVKPAFANGNYVFFLALGIPLVAVILYLRLGNLNAMSAEPTPAGRKSVATMDQGEGGRTQEDIEANVAGLAKRLQENPNDVQGWIMLGRSYMNFKKYSEASDAYAKAVALKPDDASLLADYAVALGWANGRSLHGKPQELISKALKLDPENADILKLAGAAALEDKDYTRALDYWEKLLAKLPPGSEAAMKVSQDIEETKRLAGSGK